MPTRKQKAEGAMGLVMPGAAYGAWLTRMPRKEKGPLASGVLKLAWGIKGGSLRAKELLTSLVLPTHRADPDDVMDYQTIMTLARLTRRNEDLKRRVGRLVGFIQANEARDYEGPFLVKRLLEVLLKLKAEVDQQLRISHEDLPDFDLASTHPGWVGHAARHIIRKGLWEKLATRAANGDRQDFVGLQSIDVRATTSVIRKEDGGGPKRRSLELLITGAVPTWQRCVRHHLCPVDGFAPPTSDVCPFCHCGSTETMAHLLWECKAWDEQREGMKRELEKMKVDVKDLPRITREQGIIFEDMAIIRWRKDTVFAEWEYEERPLPLWRMQEGREGGTIVTNSGHRVVFTDGSCLGQDDDRVRSAGCGVYVADGHGWNVGFPLSGIVQSSELGEARAALHVLEAATSQGFDVEVRLDNATVVATLAALVKGEEVEFEKGREIWKRAKRAIDRRKAEGGMGHIVVWIPGHTKVEDVEEGKITEENRYGNLKVDALAKEGAAVHACPPGLREGHSS